MEAFQNKNDQPTTVEAMQEQIAQNEISSFLSLAEIQERNQAELAQTDFIRHFAAALIDSAPLGTEARVYVAQRLRTTHDDDARTVYAVLEKPTNDGMETMRHIVGQEMGGTWLADEPFTDEDMALALKQLNELQQAVDSGALELDATLGAARNITATIEHGF